MIAYAGTNSGGRLDIATDVEMVAGGENIFTSGEKWKLPEETTVNKKVKKIITELTITPLITVYGARHTYGSVKGSRRSSIESPIIEA